MIAFAAAAIWSRAAPGNRFARSASSLSRSIIFELLVVSLRNVGAGVFAELPSPRRDGNLRISCGFSRTRSDPDLPAFRKSRRVSAISASLPAARRLLRVYRELARVQ
jgi:hypothetical protein